MKQAVFAQGFARAAKSSVSLFLLAALCLSLSSPSFAQKKKKNADQAPADGKPVLPMNDEQQVDYLISEMLGAWQVGDVDKLHKDYADDVSIVNGIWAPPVFGWANYLASYQEQRAHMHQVRMDRENTYIKLAGTTAWAYYQWDFSAVLDGQPTQARGQTTLILEKRNDHWVIVHNHTSIPPNQSLPSVGTPQTPPPQSTSPQAH